MATESPIRMLERTEKWAPLKQSTRFGSSSSKITIKDLGLLINDQRFQSFEKDVIIPSRCESAPPSMEGSREAVENMFLDQKSTMEGSKEVVENRKMTSHAKCVDSSGKSPGNILPIREEEFEDDGSSEQSGSVDATKENSSPAASCTNDQYHSSYKSMEEKCVSDTELPPQDTPSNSISTASYVDEQDKISTTGSNSDFNKLHKQDQLIPQNKMQQNQAGPQEIHPSQVQGFSVQMMYPGMNNSYGSLSQFHRGSSSVSMAEIQPVLQSSGFTPPLIAMGPAGFMTSPFYPNLQPAGFFSPQYNMGGYTFNSPVYPSYLPAFPYQGAVPLAYNGAYDMQNLKLYSQVGDVYGAYGHFGHQTPGAGAVLNQEDSRELRKRTNVALSVDRKSQNSAHASYNRSNIQTSNYSFGRPTIGPLEPFPTAKHVGVTNFPGDRYNGNPRKTYALQSQSWNDTTPFSFLEELKSDKGQRFELSDITGHICEFSVDQHGSRFIQQKLVTCSVEEKVSVFGEVVPNALKLMTDVFGNYVIQKLFEFGSPDQRKDLANKLEGQILPLSLQMYGCRVIQKAIEVIDLEQKTRLVKELDGHVMRCVRDQNGNHVIQKCIESIPIDKIHFIISSFRGQVATLSKHPYGCRVVQRVLEHFKDEIQTQFIIDELLHSVCLLAQDQYGNYVAQHVIGRGKPQERRAIIEKLSGSVVQLSQHKFASNVIEKCLECGDSTSRGLLIKEIIGHGDKNDNLLIMMKDQYANYVVQKILQKCTSDQREVLLALIRDHLTTLKKYTYGKHIIAQFEQLCNEETHTPEL